MWPVIRSSVAVIASFVAASAVMMVNETANTRVFYPEFAAEAAARDKAISQEAEAKGLALNSREVLLRRREAVREILARGPAGPLLVVMFGWALGSLTGGFLVAWLAGRAPVAHGLVLGGLLTLAGILNNLMLPPPAWFWIMTFIVFLPATYAGARLAPKRAAAPSEPTQSVVSSAA